MLYSIVLLLPWLVLQSVANAKMHLYFNKRFMGFGFDHTQRCYTIYHCWDDHSEDSEWSGGLPNPGVMVWFEDKYCTGDSIAKESSKGSIDFKGTKLYNEVSSFMVRQYGLYATDGIVDYCHENSTLNTTDSSFVGNLYIDLDAEGLVYNGHQGHGARGMDGKTIHHGQSTTYIRSARWAVLSFQLPSLDREFPFNKGHAATASVAVPFESFHENTQVLRRGQLRAPKRMTHQNFGFVAAVDVAINGRRQDARGFQRPSQDVRLRAHATLLHHFELLRRPQHKFSVEQLARLVTDGLVQGPALQGSLTLPKMSKGFIDFKGTKLFNTVSSFMAIEYSEYPLEGIMDKCHERIELNNGNY